MSIVVVGLLRCGGIAGDALFLLTSSTPENSLTIEEKGNQQSIFSLPSLSFLFSFYLLLESYYIRLVLIFFLALFPLSNTFFTKAALILLCCFIWEKLIFLRRCSSKIYLIANDFILISSIIYASPIHQKEKMQHFAFRGTNQKNYLFLSSYGVNYDFPQSSCSFFWSSKKTSFINLK